MLGFKKGQRGFTLIELMVVMAIMAILSGIVVGGVTGVGTTGKETTIKSDLTTIQSAVDRFYSDSDPQLYPIAAKAAFATVTATDEASVDMVSLANTGTARADSDTGNTPTSGQATVVPIDFKFPLFVGGKASANATDKFVPKYLKAVPNSVDRVTWWIRFPSAEVFWTGDVTAGVTTGKHPTSLQ